jgi:hypothetical protein
MTLKWHYINMFEKIDNSVMFNMVFGSFVHDCIRSTFLVWSQNDHNKLPLAIQVSMHQQLQSMLILKPQHRFLGLLTQINMLEFTLASM